MGSPTCAIAGRSGDQYLGTNWSDDDTNTSICIGCVESGHGYSSDECGGADNAVAPFDIRPFALPNTPPHEVWFEEPRDITPLVVEFTDTVPDELTVSYQRKVWPETRLEELSTNHPGGFGWVHQDDWFNGHWQPAAVAVTKLGATPCRDYFPGNQGRNAAGQSGRL